MTVFNRPGIIDEAAEASLALKRKIFRRDLKKPGLFLLFELILYAAVLYVGMQGISLLVIIMCNILIKAYENNPGADVFLGLGVANFNTITSLFFNIAPTIVFLVYGRVFQGRKLRTQGFVRKNALKHYLIGLAAGAGLFFLALLICLAAGSVRLAPSESFSITAIILTFLGYIIQGNAEEVMCRGHFMVSVSRRYPVWLGVALNSILFACLHLGNPGFGVLPFINILLFGFAMSLLFLRTGNIWMVSAVHTAWNFVEGCVFGVLVSGIDTGDSILSVASDTSKSLINGGSFGLEGGLAVTAVYVIGIIVLLFIKPCKDVISDK